MSARIRYLTLVPILVCGVSLAGCGTTPGDRGLSGGILGAGTGAAIGAMAGSAGTGALIGGLGGAAIGMLTSSDTINLGEPAWHHTASRRHHSSKVARNDEKCTTRDTSTQRVTTCTRNK
jgi:osmotically inducible lipoprotein OsmB